MKENHFPLLIFARMEEMDNLYTWYRQNIADYTFRRDALKKKIYTVGSLRLLLIVAAILTLWFCWRESWSVLAAILFVYALPFVALVVYHNRLFNRKAYMERMITLNENELKALDYDFSPFDGAADSIDGQHPFSLDLDLFGDRSLFQSLNRTVTLMGRDQLAESLKTPLLSKEKIRTRQEAIRELASLPSFCHEFRVTGVQSTEEKANPARLRGFFEQPNLLVKSPLWKVLVWLIPAIWVVLLLTYLAGAAGNVYLGIYFTLCFLIANIPRKKINRLYHTIDKMEKILSGYAHLMELIEKDTFHAPELQDLQAKLRRETLPASAAIKQLSGYLGALDQRYSLIGILLNIFYLRDTRKAMQMEAWKIKYQEDITPWFEALAGFDALISLANFAKNHPDYCYPEIADRYFEIEGKALGHPLIHRDKCVRNDIDIPKSSFFLIITGANMAGKSTFLRTVGINYLLGCLGTPVCAESLTFYPAHLVTSLRTADSLASNESYFFAELKRLKMIIDRLKEGEELFIILDEILKGTNSMDKQKGSIALMKQLVANKACGIIATHDLVLGNLEQEFPEQIKNYRFEADITDNELTFTYRLREGVAQNMNASFLMKKMGITME